ncbi:MAG TPA: hypothetical protein VGQ55_11825 [Pyrinomonadaceae bacterium]|jgi:hypothetical protein|nr:hypothetical protein [Pyrinomonadaceae bacterium]
MTKGFIYMFAALLAGCAVKGEPIEFSKACAIENDGKTFEVKGVLSDRGSVFCSNIGGGRLECGFDLLESAGSTNKMGAEIEEGSGSNTVTKLESGYKKSDIKVRDNSGSQIALGTDVVKATGKVSVAPAAPGGEGVCFMQVAKIEK